MIATDETKPGLAASPDEVSRKAAERTERENLGWIVVFGIFTKQFVCFRGSRRGRNDSHRTEGYRKLSARAFADLHLIVSKVLISARRA